ncbi:MAG: CBS domain-containing protein [Saprospiraceae bacterium]
MQNVSTIMTKNVVSVREDTVFSAIKALFDKHHFHHLPVLDEKHQLKGIISREDLGKASIVLSLHTAGKTYSELAFNHITAKDLMSSYPVFLTPDDSIDLAADIFLSNKMHAVPILDDGELIGIVTTHDLLRYAFTDMRAGLYTD